MHALLDKSIYPYPIDSASLTQDVELLKKVKFYDLMFKRSGSVPAELVQWIETNRPEQYKLNVLNENVATLHRNVLPLLKTSFLRFIASPVHGEIKFKYAHDTVNYFGQIYHDSWTDTTTERNTQCLNFNIKLNEDRFLFSPPELLPGSIVRPDLVRHQCRGWALLSRKMIDENLPHLRLLAEDLLADEISFTAAYYNFQEEMLDAKFGKKNREKIVLSFDTCQLDREMVMDEWYDEDLIVE